MADQNLLNLGSSPFTLSTECWGGGGGSEADQVVCVECSAGPSSDVCYWG